MLTRIVKMTFQRQKLPEFYALFQGANQKIRAFPGCTHLELWQDADDPRIIFTYSLWEDAHALEAYRQSDLFRSTWVCTKLLFASKPVAWSVNRLQRLGEDGRPEPPSLLKP